MAGSKGKIKFGGNPKSIIKQGGSPKTDIRQGGDPESIMQMNPSWRLASCDVDPSISWSFYEDLTRSRLLGNYIPKTTKF